MARPAGQTLCLTAKQHLGPAPGGSSGAQLYEVNEDAKTYVVKFKGSNQGIRVLFNEYVCGRIGELIGVPFGDHALVDVPEPLHPPDGTQNITQRLFGVQFCTTFYRDAQSDLTQLKRATNFQSDFPGVLVFDTFVLRGDSRQHLVYSGPNSQGGNKDLFAIFDQGFAFTGTPVWTEVSLTQQCGCTANNGLNVRGDLGGIATYEPYIQRVEALTQGELQAVVNEPPLADWQVTAQEAAALANWLNVRKTLVRGAIQAYVV